MRDTTSSIQFPLFHVELGKRLVMLGATVVAATACTTVLPSSDISPPGDPGVVASDAGAGDAAASDAAASDTAASDAAADDAGVPVDAGPGGTDAGPVVPRVPLWALAVGRTWVWNHTGCQLTMSVTGTQNVDNRQAFVEVLSGCNVNGSNLEVVYPDDRKEWRAGSQWVPIDVPSEGHTWRALNITYSWRRTGNVTVPAGTFSDCWILRQETMTISGPTIYVSDIDSFVCRGAGVVRMDASANGGPTNTFRTLVSKNF